MQNASVKEKAAEGLLQDVLEKCKSDLNAIAALETGVNEPALIDYYKTCYDINSVIRKAQDIKSAAEAKKRQEEKAAPAIVQSPIYKPEDEPAQISVSETAEETPVIQVDFRVWGTKEQLLKLQAFLKENSLRYGKVE